MDLLTNAIESIQVGVDDWQVGTRPRILSAVRNIHAGILLLYKEALLRLSPPNSNDALIKARLKATASPGQPVRFVGAGQKTVDTQQIKERFASLGIQTDWTRFKSIADVRNDIEHYFADVSRNSTQGVVASAFLIIRSFCIDELDEDPRQLLGQRTWQLMLDAADVYEAERSACEAALANVNWESDALSQGVHSLRCKSCGSDLLHPSDGSSYSDTDLQCRSCGATQTSDEYIPTAVAASLEWETYLAATDGDDNPIAQCPSCYVDAYIMDEERCALCGEQAEHVCSVCGSWIPPSEMSSSPICGYCEHRMSRD